MNNDKEYHAVYVFIYVPFSMLIKEYLCMCVCESIIQWCMCYVCIKLTQHVSQHEHLHRNNGPLLDVVSKSFQIAHAHSHCKPSIDLRSPQCPISQSRRSSNRAAIHVFIDLLIIWI